MSGKGWHVGNGSSDFVASHHGDGIRRFGIVSHSDGIYCKQIKHIYFSQ